FRGTMRLEDLALPGHGVQGAVGRFTPGATGLLRQMTAWWNLFQFHPLQFRRPEPPVGNRAGIVAAEMEIEPFVGVTRAAEAQHARSNARPAAFNHIARAIVALDRQREHVLILGKTDQASRLKKVKIPPSRAAGQPRRTTRQAGVHGASGGLLTPRQA